MPAGSLEALRLFAAAYLVLVALAAVLGYQRQLLAYPFRVCYSIVRLFLLVVTARRVRMVPLATHRQSSKRLRALHDKLAHRRVRPERDTIATDDWQAGDSTPIDLPPRPPEDDEDEDLSSPSFDFDN